MRAEGFACVKRDRGARDKHVADVSHANNKPNGDGATCVRVCACVSVTTAADERRERLVGLAASGG